MIWRPLSPTAHISSFSACYHARRALDGANFAEHAVPGEERGARCATPISAYRRRVVAAWVGLSGLVSGLIACRSRFAARGLAGRVATLGLRVWRNRRAHFHCGFPALQKSCCYPVRKNERKFVQKQAKLTAARHGRCDGAEKDFLVLPRVVLQAGNEVELRPSVSEEQARVGPVASVAAGRGHVTPHLGGGDTARLPRRTGSAAAGPPRSGLV